jgi:hypothetical protein
LSKGLGKILVWCSVFVILYFGGAVGLVKLGMVSLRPLPENLIAHKVFDSELFFKVIGWVLTEEWWLALLFGVAIVIATVAVKYGFRSKPRRA